MSEVENSVSNMSQAESAVALVLSGASLSDVVRVLKFKSQGDAKRVIERTLASTVTVDEKKYLQMVATQRYEKLLKSVMTRATNPKESNQLAYNQRAQSIIDRLVKLQGLEAPTQVQISPSDEFLASYANKFKESLGLDSNVPQEADILEESDLDDDYGINNA